jgi:hypothetical protein
VNGIITIRNDRDMNTLTDQAHNSHAPLAIILSRVVFQHGGCPIDVRHKVKRQVARRDIPGVFGWIERQPHLNYRYSKNVKVSTFAVPAIP